MGSTFRVGTWKKGWFRLQVRQSRTTKDFIMLFRINFKFGNSFFKYNFLFDILKLLLTIGNWSHGKQNSRYAKTDYYLSNILHLGNICMYVNPYVCMYICLHVCVDTRLILFLLPFLSLTSMVDAHGCENYPHIFNTSYMLVIKTVPLIPNVVKCIWRDQV